LYAEKFFDIQRCSLCEAGCGVPKSRHFNYQHYDNRKKENRTAYSHRSPHPPVQFKLTTKKISGLKRYFQKPDWKIVKAVNAHFSNVTVTRQIAALEQRTRELKAISIDEIRNLAKQATEWLK